MGVPERYSRNVGAFTEAELLAVREKSACVVGCGGLGGYAAAGLARFGFGRLTLIDGDSFCLSNLNRQLFSTEANLNKNKALAAAAALKDINSDVTVSAHPVMLDINNAPLLLKNHDIVIDCLDSIPARRLLADACDTLGIPLVHGAISGFYGQVTCIFPGDKLMDMLYPAGCENDAGIVLGNPNFTPQLVAAIQSCEAVKLAAGRGTNLRNRVLYIDMLKNDYEIVGFLPD